MFFFFYFFSSLFFSSFSFFSYLFFYSFPLNSMINTINNSILFVYKESSCFYLQTYLGSLKIKLKLNCMSSISSLGLHVNKSVFYNSTFFEKLKSRLLDRLNQLTFSLVYGFNLKYKIKGLGYKSFFKDQILMFKLGYSHKVFFILPMDLISKQKKKKKHFIQLEVYN